MSVHRRFKHLAIDGMCSMAISVVCPAVPFKIRQSLLCAKSLKTLANRKLQFFYVFLQCSRENRKTILLHTDGWVVRFLDVFLDILVGLGQAQQISGHVWLRASSIVSLT